MLPVVTVPYLTRKIQSPINIDLYICQLERPYKLVIFLSSLEAYEHEIEFMLLAGPSGLSCISLCVHGVKIGGDVVNGPSPFFTVAYTIFKFPKK